MHTLALMAALALCVACRTGDKAAAEGILAEARGDALALIRDSNALGEACAGGALKIVLWLTTFGLTREDTREALRRACRERDIKCAGWLTATFGLTTEDARAENNCILQWASAHGHLDVVKWLMGKFDFTVADCNNALAAAYDAGQYAVAELLKPDREGARIALRAVCSDGSLDDVRWLVATFNLSAADIRDVGLPAAQRPA